ncbi:DsbA family oxidoreductase [Rubrobacter tropicus]|uniref:DsbA family oxidoreductase n=1 Tax=Rubrobacter tropicus TaxID=2653851 RepID=A0A6G8QDC4_9ACTN|nr:DsbA family oxidoreductase [Rubrobacter tropicus]QIN84401.1 DsbA family oxidoreductase [Rubrobacter tropicus]
MKVEVYADVACAWCRLRTHQFHRAVAAAGGEGEVELVHLPYQLDSGGTGEPRPLMEVMAEMFGRDRADMMAAGMTRLGADEGVEYRFDRALAVDTFAAHRLLWFALREHGAGPQAALARALYEAHFRDGANVADHAELAALAGRVGLNGERARGFLASDGGVAEVRERVAAARRDGISSVPTFVFEDGERHRGEDAVEAIADALGRPGVAGSPGRFPTGGEGGRS